ncbi:hypothetical protein D3C75_900640 [compost metagenome]
MGDDGLANVGLPHANHGYAVMRDTAGVHQAVADRERTDRRRQVAAVAAPVNEGLVDGHLTEQVIDVVIGLGAFRQDHGFAGAGGRAAHAVDLFVVRVGAADHAQQQRVAGRARDLRRFRQVLETEEHAFAGAAAHVCSWNLDLSCVSHGARYS